MGDFIETLKLAEKAQEDIYFAKIDRELKKSGRAADRKVSGAA